MIIQGPDIFGAQTGSLFIGTQGSRVIIESFKDDALAAPGPGETGINRKRLFITGQRFFVAMQKPQRAPFAGPGGSRLRVQRKGAIMGDKRFVAIVQFRQTVSLIQQVARCQHFLSSFKRSRIADDGFIKSSKFIAQPFPVLRPSISFFTQTAQGKCFENRWDRHDHDREFGFLPDVGGHPLVERPCFEKLLSGQHFKKDRAEGVNIGALIDRVPLTLFWSHIGRGADDSTRVSQAKFVRFRFRGV